MKIHFLTILLFIASFLSQGSISLPVEDEIINGYMKKIEGVETTKQSSIPAANQSMIIWNNNGKSMVWETAPLPEETSSDVTFAWLAGIGTSQGSGSFDLSINGIKKVSFRSQQKETWEEKGEDGITLSFRQKMIDQHGDRFGYMFLTVPVADLKEKEPVRIKADLAPANKSSWYMTFQFPLEKGMTVHTLPGIVKSKDGQYRKGEAGFFHTSKPAPASVYLDNELIEEVTLNFGYNPLNLKFPVVEKETTISCRVETGSKIYEETIELDPVRPWKVNFVQHTHTDIGYTRSQTEILGEHLRFIDYALDYCDMTDDYPDAAKFRWSCEATWPVNEYLRSRPAKQVERLKKRVAEGRIEITGMYFNFDELPDEQILAASLEPLKNIKKAGLEVNTAMQNDVNGIGWCLNDYYNDLGVKYLNMGTHGHKALICFDKPTLFWWESPSGNKMLAYRAEHYMYGNFFGIHEKNFDAFENKLLTYLTELENKGYQYDITSIQHSGYFTDNSPPSTRASDMIKKWNAKYAWPKLSTATAKGFFEEMEKKYADQFQTFRGAWPDWWTDGFGASAREVETTRQAQTDLIANMAGLSMAALQGSPLPEAINDRIYWTNNALLFYTEHTVGYHASIREPFHKYTMEQRAIKESYAWEAGRRSKMIGEEALGLLQSHITKEKKPSVVVWNSLNWEKNGLVKVYMDHQLVPPDKKFSIIDREGNQVPAQPVESHNDGTYWALWVENVPAFGYKKYVIEVSDEPKKKGNGNEKNLALENQWYKIEVDHERGAITRLFDKKLNKELVDQEARWKMGEFIYETLGKRGQLDGFYLDDYQRVPLDSVWFEGYEKGEIWNTISFSGNTEAAIRDEEYSFKIRLLNTTKRIDLAYFILKKSVTDPEGIYIALPFKLNEGIISFDVQGGEIRAGIDQIPGSSNDWNTVQNYARLANEEEQILLSSREIPLMQFGAINLGRFETGATPETGHMFGWPMNNYWVTNFNAEQRGGIDWVYTISSATNASQNAATRFGWGNRIPFLARVLPGGGKGGNKWQQSFISGWPENTLLVSCKPSKDGQSCTLHVRETSGKEADLNSLQGLNNSPLELTEINVLEERIPGGSLKLKPFDSKFIRLTWN